MIGVFLVSPSKVTFTYGFSSEMLTIVSGSVGFDVESVASAVFVLPELVKDEKRLDFNCCSMPWSGLVRMKAW